MVSFMPLTVEQQAALNEWRESAAQSKFWKERESALRDAIVAALFDSSKDEGSQTIEIVPGWSAKATKKLDYKLDNSDDKVIAVCAILDGDLAPKLIKWKPELSISTYKQLDAPTQALFNGCLTIKPAKPTLEIIQVKGN
jgi:hypothetical protein